MNKTITFEFIVPDNVDTMKALDVLHENFCGFQPYVDSQVVVSQNHDNLDGSANLTVFTNELTGTQLTEAISRTEKAFAGVLEHVYKTIENEDLKENK